MSGGGRRGWMGQTQDFYPGDQSASPVCDQSRLIFKLCYVSNLNYVTDVTEVK